MSVFFGKPVLEQDGSRRRRVVVREIRFVHFLRVTSVRQSSVRPPRLQSIDRVG